VKKEERRKKKGAVQLDSAFFVENSVELFFTVIRQWREKETE